MKLFLISWAILSQIITNTPSITPSHSNPDTLWHTRYDKALEDANRLDRPVFIVFSGSDWCAACIRFKRDVLSQPEFIAFAKDALVLLNLDFPRRKKNRLPEPLVLENSKLASQYNAEGLFPRAVLVDKQGKVLWDYKESFYLEPQQLVSYLKNHL